MLTFVLSSAIILVGVLMGYGTSRRFVRDRLRYVDRVHKPAIPWIVGIAAFLVSLPVVSLVSWLPLIHLGGGAAIALGASVGLGVRAGTKDIREGRYELHA
jgi:UDP-N-acetylmuramyl pentapeptide phosphotransferase/UDP-N-acetylglucosamine-1-phosphate transferase